ncbi:MAG: hypothetical protein NC406_07810 [Bacteroides sp.]|nr:hypothetical protein [Bacteroides sp.]MCM1095780.1 hypothetical protein [Terasakiella sp.]
MKKISTSPGGLTATPAGRRRTPAPAASTVAFLRQFARAYIPGPRPMMPGIILN